MATIQAKTCEIKLEETGRISVRTFGGRPYTIDLSGHGSSDGSSAGSIFAALVGALEDVTYKTILRMGLSPRVDVGEWAKDEKKPNKEK